MQQEIAKAAIALKAAVGDGCIILGIAIKIK